MSIFKKRGTPEAEQKRRIVALFGDTHGGNDHGLLSPDTQLPSFDREGNEYYISPQLNDIQLYLWQLYTYHVDKCMELADGDEVIPEHDGDIAQGTKHLDEGLMSLNAYVQQAIAEANMHPWLISEAVKTMRFIEGTQAHDGLGNSMSYTVAHQLQTLHPDKNIRCVPHALMDVDGFKIDASHHGPPPGSRSWLKGNEARFYLRDRMLREIQAGRKPADLYHRAHYHDLVIEELRVNGYKATLIVTPSYTFPGAWTKQATKSVYEVTNGMIALEIEDGKLREIHELIERTDIRTREAL